jgi:hypothetical protein
MKPLVVCQASNSLCQSGARELSSTTKVTQQKRGASASTQRRVKSKGRVRFPKELWRDRLHDAGEQGRVNGLGRDILLLQRSDQSSGMRCPA